MIGGVITSMNSTAPTFRFGEFGTIDFTPINEILDTPISFGFVETQFGQWEPQHTNIPTERYYNA